MAEVSFNSLQTGKRIQRPLMLIAQRTRSMCFNSLQTGKCIQSVSMDESLEAESLFQFPSNGKVDPKEHIQDKPEYRDTSKFQFPSNGKVYPKYYG